jgi:uncharacterized protein with von Willebrand factor type A (vWA) domain
MPEAAIIDAGPALSARMSRYVRLLRDNGFSAGIAEAADALRALAMVGAKDVHQVRRAMRILFSAREREWRRFNDIFDAFWLGKARHRRSIARKAAGMAASVQGERAAAGRQRGTLADFVNWRGKDDQAAGGGQPGEARASGASAIENLAKADFGRVTDPEELERLHALCEQWAERLRSRLSRRRRAARKGEKLLLRRTFQRSVSVGGIPIKLFRSRRKPKPVRIIIFVDVSGSMDLYSLFFTRFVYALSLHLARTEAFIFHTRLVHVTGALMQANPMKMMEKMALISQGWSGGTKIGAALAEFNRAYAPSLATSNTLALIVSDGFDTGRAETLANELAQLKRRVRRLIWLNPLLGRDSYEPRAAGMAAALPHLDLFAPAHNLESLAALEGELARL